MVPKSMESMKKNMVERFLRNVQRESFCHARRADEYDWSHRSICYSCGTASLAQWLRRPPRERKISGSNPACAEIFSGSSHTSDLKTGTPVATLPGAWHYRVSAGTGRTGVSILWLGEVESLICDSYLSVVARKIVCADPSLRYTSMLLGR